MSLSYICDRYVLLFFFFKQKTAYEMRISDWSSDVCSSDLISSIGRPPRQARRPLKSGWSHVATNRSRSSKPDGNSRVSTFMPAPPGPSRLGPSARHDGLNGGSSPRFPGGPYSPCRRNRRSEEHTSELQSLMRISYAVFCLK